MQWNSTKVLVTGAGGFIGSHLVERLVILGAKVKAFVRYNSTNSWGWLDTFPKELQSEIEICRGDIRDFYSLNNTLKDIDIIFHLAALIAIPYSYKSPESYIKTNIEGTLNILHAGLNNEIKRIVHTSTSEVYGSAQYVPIDEKHPLYAQSPYSATKIGADKLAESFYLSFNLPVSIIRPFNTYGPRQSLRAVIPTIILQALTTNIIKIGDVTPTRDLTYVEDTVDGFIKIVESPNSIGEIINVGSNFEIAIRDLVIKIGNLLNKELIIDSQEERFRPSKSEVERLWADNSKAKKLLGWKPKYSIDEGLKLTIDWLKENISKYKPEIFNI